MAKEKLEQLGNQASIVIEDLTLNETNAENVKGGDGTIRVHYDTGYGNRIAIRGGE